LKTHIHAVKQIDYHTRFIPAIEICSIGNYVWCLIPLIPVYNFKHIFAGLIELNNPVTYAKVKQIHCRYMRGFCVFGKWPNIDRSHAFIVDNVVLLNNGNAFNRNIVKNVVIFGF